MPERWFYILAGNTCGPVDADHIHGLIAEGKLTGSDWVWPEGVDVQLPVASFTSLTRKGQLPDWLEDVRQSTPGSSRLADEPSLPSWLEDIRQAERPAPSPAAAIPTWLDDVREAESAAPAPVRPPADGPAPPRPTPTANRIGSDAPASLVAALREHHLLRSEQLDVVHRELLSLCPNPRTLARALIRKGWLTACQAKFLLADRGAELVVGPYRLLDRLGAGGMGVVWKAWHVRMDRVVALKLISRERLKDPRAIERFFREARVAAQLQHPNIVLAYDADRAGDHHYFAMEYVPGIDLRALIREVGPLPISQACDFARQVALGLHHAYERGIVHRDIKPSNVLLRSVEEWTRTANPEALARSSRRAGRRLEGAIPKIADFGLARLEADDSQLTKYNAVLGTVDFISPEQATDASSADIRSDIYSLGCTLFNMLTARLPFEGGDTIQRVMARVLNDAPSVRHFRPDVPAGLEKVLAGMLAREAAARCPIPAEAGQRLEPFC